MPTCANVADRICALAVLIPNRRLNAVMLLLNNGRSGRGSHKTCVDTTSLRELHDTWPKDLESTCSLHCSSFLGLPHRILIIYLGVKPEKGTTMETTGSLWVRLPGQGVQGVLTATAAGLEGLGMLLLLGPPTATWSFVQQY